MAISPHTPQQNNKTKHTTDGPTLTAQQLNHPHATLSTHPHYTTGRRPGGVGLDAEPDQDPELLRLRLRPPRQQGKVARRLCRVVSFGLGFCCLWVEVCVVLVLGLLLWVRPFVNPPTPPTPNQTPDPKQHRSSAA